MPAAASQSGCECGRWTRTTGMLSRTSVSTHRGTRHYLPAATAAFRFAPTWVDTFLFLALMSGPPQFTPGRDPAASLAGEIDSSVLFRITVWACAGLWVFVRLAPLLLRRGILPPLNRILVAGGLLIAALSLSVLQSPGILLTAFTLYQYAMTLLFGWLFVQRFGVVTYLRQLFFGVTVLALMVATAAFVAPDLVIQGVRLRGDGIADTGTVAVFGLILCLSNLVALRRARFWTMMVLFGVLLVGSQTRAAYVALAAYLAIGFVYGKDLRVRQLVPLLAVATVGLLVFDVLSTTTAYIVRDTSSLETMSDRIPLWQYLTDVVMREAPLTGLGYYAASRVWAARYNPGLGTAHSAFFEILLGGGLIAAAAYVVLCALLVWSASRLLQEAGHRPEVIATIGILAYDLMTGVTAVSVHVGPSGFTFWSMPALLPALWRLYAPRPVASLRPRPVRTITSQRRVTSPS